MKHRILVVDDMPENVTLMVTALGRDGYLTNSAVNGEEALHKIKAWAPSLILLDVNMPGLNGLQTLKEIRKSPDKDYTSVIFVTANSSTDDVVAGLDAGANDYIIKPFRVPELLARVRAQLRIKELQDQLRINTKRLEEMVDTDYLTGLFNMRSMFNRVEQELYRVRRYKRWASCIMLDMDHFKMVNDKNDHLFGSYVLTEVAKIIKTTMRASDIAARYGGDEFLVFSPETDHEGGVRFAERIRKAVEGADFRLGSQSTKLTCSLGVASVSFDKEIDAKNLVRAADEMLYAAKEGGRNQARSKKI